jgi:hypothetical protein
MMFGKVGMLCVSKRRLVNEGEMTFQVTKI